MSQQRACRLDFIRCLLWLTFGLGLLSMVMSILWGINVYHPFFSSDAWQSIFVIIIFFFGLMAVFSSLYTVNYIKNKIIAPLKILSQTVGSIVSNKKQQNRETVNDEGTIEFLAKQLNTILQRVVTHEITFAKKIELANQTATQAEKIINQIKENTDYSAIFNKMPISLIVVSETLKIIAINQSACDFYQVNKQNVIGEKYFESIQWPSIEETMLREVIQSDKMKMLGQYECQKNNTTHISEVIIYPISMQKTHAAVIQISDITHQVQNEKAFAQADKMTSVRGLAAGMAHELNNPLGGIMQNAQNILRRIDPNMQKNLEIAEQCHVDLKNMTQYFEKRGILKFLAAINQFGERAAEIIKHMLQFSGNDGLKEKTDLNEIVRRAHALALNDEKLGQMIVHDQIKIELNLTEKNAVLLCNAAEIEQVILSIIKNAMQAIHQKKIAQGDDYQPLLTLSTTEQGKFLSIEVSDNGSGIEKNIINRIFEPFFTTHDIGEGTGLGLAVSYFLITANHHGQISVESEQGHGSRFKVLLPR